MQKITCHKILQFYAERFCLSKPMYLDVYILGGNQREKSREKAAKKQKEAEKKKQASDKGANKGMTLEERRHR